MTVEAGEFFVLFGPSAAGKTTTLRVIAGLERPAAGSVEFSGADVTQSPVQGRDVGMIFQTFALYPHMTVFGNLAHPLRGAGQLARAEIDRRVAEPAEMLRITHTLNRKPGTLSGGEQQRLPIVVITEGERVRIRFREGQTHVFDAGGQRVGPE